MQHKSLDGTNLLDYSLNMSDRNNDDRPKFASGDQDYDSARGWDPIKENAARMRAEAIKKDPRAFAPMPDMLFVQEAQYYINGTVEYGAIQQLFGPFWLMDETAILFAPPGVGKSALATQIAESLARGVPFAPFTEPRGPILRPQRVLYIDFELSRSQFAARYTVRAQNNIDLLTPYQFSPQLFRAEMYWNGKLLDGYEDYTDMLFEDILNEINDTRADVLIIDNITFLTRGSTANSTVAFRLMDRFRDLKRSSFISVLLVAHTPKRRRASIMTENDMQGSVDLAKVADSVFAIGRSRVDRDLRYLKHIKCRSGVIEHGTDNIALFRLRKFDFAGIVQPGVDGPRADNFFGFDFIGLGHEMDHLELDPAYPNRPKPAYAHSKDISRAKALSARGKSIAEIAEELGVAKTTAYRYVKRI
jgi:predicted ATP-dependent serine protease